MKIVSASGELNMLRQRKEGKGKSDRELVARWHDAIGSENERYSLLAIASCALRLSSVSPCSLL